MTISCLIKSEGYINAFLRGFRSGMSRIRGRLLLGSGGRTSGPGLRIIGMRYLHMSGGCSFGSNCRVEAYDTYLNQKFSPSIVLSPGCHFGDNVHIGAIGDITIGPDALFGSKILVIDHDHGIYVGHDSDDPRTPPRMRRLLYKGRIVIGANVWVGDNAVIMGGAEIGDGAIIAAGAFVNKPIPPGSVCVGQNKVVKKFDFDKSEWIGSAQ